MEKVGRIAKILVLFIMFFLIGLIILRCCFAADKSCLSDIYPTEGAKAVYAQSGSEMEILTHEVVAEIATDGYMSCYAFAYIPAAKEVQITVRYNDSVFEYNSLPEDTVFTYVLTDTDTGETYSATVADEETRLMYHYFRLIFTGVTLTETNDLEIQMFAGEEEISNDTLHYADQNVVIETYKLSKKEKQALGA